MRKWLVRTPRPRPHRESPARRAVWVVCFLLATAALFVTTVLPARVSLSAGEVAPLTVTAPRDFIDQPTTDRLRNAAAQQVAPVYSTVQAVVNSAMNQFDQDLSTLQHVRADVKLSASQRVTQLRNSILLPVSDADYQSALGLGGPTLAALGGATRADLAAAFEHGVYPTSVSQAQQALTREVRSLPYPASATAWFASLGSSLVQSNEVVDQAATTAARNRAAAAVAPVMILKGQAIVHEGDLVTADDMVRLKDAGLLEQRGGAGVMVGALLVAALLEALAGGYLVLFRRDVLRREPRLVLFGLTALAALGAIRLALRLTGYLAPLPWAAMLVTVSFDPQLAVFLTLLLAISTGLLSHDLSLAMVTLVLGLAAAFSIRRINQRSDLMRAGVLAGAAGAVTLLALGLFFGGGLDRQALVDAGLVVTNGLLCGVLVIGTLPYVEFGFGLLTPMRLMELANPQQPMLRRLLLEAPGTYHHSLMVANLSEAACEAIGGDSLLARVGAYYHDIGKVKRPYFFIENQLGGENPHDKLSPNLSALVITSHVKDGVEMAREHKLPEELIDFIRTHHGTTLVSYFYNRARQIGECIESNFRYDGPIPGTREQAVVMLADGVEASVRAAAGSGQPDRVEATVRGIVKERLDGGQLARADLTLREIDDIVSTFIHVLNGVYHHRVEYPEQVVQEIHPRRAVGS